MSLCLIVGNVAEYIERCLTSFAPIADEIIIVRAIGSQEADETSVISWKVCKDLGKPLVWGEYKNAPGHEDWPHVDSFAAARQMSFDLASGTYRFWCDTDDVLACDPQLIRDHARRGAEAGTPVFIFPYDIFGRGVTVPRERMIHRNVKGRWMYPVHECFAFDEPAQGISDERVIVQHLPKPTKTGSMDRNLRILEAIPEADLTPGLLYHLHCEQQGAGRITAAVESAKKALMHPDLGRPERYELLLNLAILCDDLRVGIQYLQGAFATDPTRREALGLLAATSIDCGRPAEALAYARQMMATARPEEWNWNDRGHAYGWIGEDIMQQCLRANGLNSEAEKLRRENLEAHKDHPRISLIHATRGRARQASATRKAWHDLAEHPERLEHIFAIDADDEASAPLARFHHCVVPITGGGCVAAWNAGTTISTGDVVIQLSDDWIPPAKWDTLILERLGDLSKASVLAVSDGHRSDQLLCMAIATSAYVILDRFLFHPAFLSVYSDNWFTELAYSRGAVIEARDLVFTHNHPFFNKEVALDRTYEESNAPARYEQGMRELERLRTGNDWSFVPGFFNYIAFYDYIAGRVPDGATIAEVGVWLGRSIIYLADKLKRLGKHSVKILAIDHFKGEINQPEHLATVKEHGGSIREAFQRNIERCGVADMITVIDGDSAGSAEQVPDHSLAFCYIDAAHDLESVRRDIRAWLPKITAGGLLSGHDAQWHEVKAAVTELLPAAKILDPIWFHHVVQPFKRPPVLSILIPSIPERREQCQELIACIKEDASLGGCDHLIEVLSFIDDKKRSVGAKRQALQDMARGDYIAFVDDDDTVSRSYLVCLIEAAEGRPDVITFKQQAVINGVKGTIIFDANQKTDEPWRPGESARRRPWHVCAWRRELIQHCRFGDCNYGEDRVWVDQAAPLIKTSHHIDEVLHVYRHDEKTTAAPPPR